MIEFSTVIHLIPHLISGLDSALISQLEEQVMRFAALTEQLQLASNQTGHSGHTVTGSKSACLILSWDSWSWSWMTFNKMFKIKHSTIITIQFVTSCRTKGCDSVVQVHWLTSSIFLMCEFPCSKAIKSRFHRDSQISFSTFESEFSSIQSSATSLLGCWTLPMLAALRELSFTCSSIRMGEL